MKYLWRRDEELQLLRLVRARPPLYNQKDRNYKNIRLRNGLWSEISRKLGGIPGDVAKTKWRLIRDQYMRVRASLQKGCRSRAEADRLESTKGFSLFSEVDEFLAAHAQHRSSSDSHDNTQVMFSDDTDGVKMPSQSGIRVLVFPSPRVSSSAESVEPASFDKDVCSGLSGGSSVKRKLLPRPPPSTPQSTSASGPLESPQRGSGRLNGKVKEQAFEAAFADFCEERQERKADDHDQWYHFGQEVAQSMREHHASDPKNAHATRIAILQLIYKAKFED